ncbi:LysE family translocator [Pseudomonas sp. SST3]|uniref:LysE family translocator n=1 Tax=Pseudomonas sp. SST3 TaxID=2267882 RepID=UPI000E034854|nr:LysE family translocator [Pseudomonas sp. SST3]NKQ11409.1 LysE family translocator [Pseudomonas sp. SST3]
MIELLPFALFAFVASITPGPTNVLVLNHSVRFGFRGALPIVLGGCAGAALMVLTVGVGVGDAVAAHAMLQTLMKGLGIIWLSHLAWQIYWTPEPEHRNGQAAGPRLGFLASAGLQLINPKAWMMAVAVISVFTRPGTERWHDVAQLSLMFFCISLPCLAAWALLGRGAAAFLTPRARRIMFNRSLAAMLLLSALASLLP